MADGGKKNLQVTVAGVQEFMEELQAIDREVERAWRAGDWRRFLHKVSAPPPEFFGLCRRLLGYLVMPLYYPPALIWYTVKNLYRTLKRR